MRVVDVDRIGTPPAPIAVDEAWVVDPADRRSGLPGRTGPTASAPGGRAQRPQLVVRPGPIAELEVDVAQNRAAGGPRIVRLCPGPSEHDFPLEPWVLSPLPEYCDREGIAVLVDPGPAPVSFPWSGIVRLARDHPSLVIVALAVPLGGPAAARALDAAPNLVLETSGLTDETTDDLGRLVEVAGAYRFTYGSGDRRIPALAIEACLARDDAQEVLAGTADLIDRGAWGATYL
jgi:hypothetical protein